MGIATAVATPARADGPLDGVLVTVVVSLLVADVAFAVHGISAAADSKLPGKDWAISEMVVTIPQTLAFNGLYVGLRLKDAGQDSDGLYAAGLIPTMGVSILTTHGIWATATTNVRPGVLAGSSIAVGIDVALTSGVLASLGAGRFPGRSGGVVAMVFTGPQVAATSYLAAISPASDRAGWIALSAWSGALFTYGLVSAIHDHGSAKVAPTAEPPPPPLTPDKQPPLLVPGSLRLGPTVVTDGVASAVGLGISGKLF